MATVQVVLELITPETSELSSSSRLIVTCCVPFSEAPLTVPISMIMVSVPSTTESSTAVTVVVPVNEPAEIVMELALL